MTRLRAAVIGLGKVGLRFNEEPGRKTVWTHVGAYLSLPEHYELVAGCDTEDAAASMLKSRCPEARFYGDVATMVRELDPDVVSICTPPASHPGVLTEVLAGSALRAVWCEKPLAETVAAGEDMVARGRARAVTMVVSHVRRWSPLWQAARTEIENGHLGAIRCVRVAMGNRLWTIGSHAVDLALFLGGEVASVQALEIPALYEDGEPARAALLLYKNSAYGIVQVTGHKRALLVEAEVIGDAGRMTVREDLGEIVVEPFEPSHRYAGYCEPGGRRAEQFGTQATVSPFVEIARDIARGAKPLCSAEDALAGLKVLERMAGSSLI